MDNSTPITEELRSHIYNTLADTMINAVEDGTLPYEEMQRSSQFILSRLDSIANHQELLLFLEDLSKEWPAYSASTHSLKESILQQKDQQQIEERRQEINQAIS